MGLRSMTGRMTMLQMSRWAVRGGNYRTNLPNALQISGLASTAVLGPAHSSSCRVLRFRRPRLERFAEPDQFPHQAQVVRLSNAANCRHR